MKECRKISDLLGAYVYGDLALDEMRRVRTHADTCDACRIEVEALRRTVALVPSDLPKLTDEERLRVTWAVKGAVRAKSEASRLRVFAFAAIKGFAIVMVVGSAFGFGALYGVRAKPAKVIVKYVPERSQKHVAASDVSIPSEPKTLYAADPFRRPYGVETSRSGSGVVRRHEEEEPDANASVPGVQMAESSPVGNIIENQSAPEAQETTAIDPVWPALPEEPQGEGTGE